MMRRLREIPCRCHSDMCIPVIYVSLYTYPGDMCIPGGDTINTDAHPRHNKEISSLAKGNVVDII